MVVTPALAGDLPAIERLYRSAIEVMRDTPLDIWWEWGLHPTPEKLAAETARGNVLVAVEDASSVHRSGSEARAVYGVMVLNDEQGSDYAQAQWPVDALPDEVAVIHLFGIAPDARGKGWAKAMLAAAADTARKRGAKALRLDVFDNNAPAIALYRACGFTDLGAFDLAVGGGLRHRSHLMELAL